MSRKKTQEIVEVAEGTPVRSSDAARSSIERVIQMGRQIIRLNAQQTAELCGNGATQVATKPKSGYRHRGV
jgi:hypothetical protein